MADSNEQKLTGRSFIGSSRGSETSKTFTAFNPQDGNAAGPDFYSATRKELDGAVVLADLARIAYGRTESAKRAAFLRQIAENIESLGDQLIDRAALETGLPASRFQGERGRTCSQFRLFADLVEEGSWVDARIDPGDPERKPVPKPDIRSMYRPIGPVAVFCAGNFPLAFSVAGGDTASALSAGCPVIVNAHPAHPGTAELVGIAIAEAVKSCGLPEGTFSLLFSSNYQIGQSLVAHPLIKAVGFTGSRKGGRALMDIAASRNEPIPVYAEMSSVNPTFILPGALARDGEGIAHGLHSSFTLGFGQFCTKPGIVVIPDSNESADFTGLLLELTAATPPSPLLTGQIQTAYSSGIESHEMEPLSGEAVKAGDGYAVSPSVFATDAERFLNSPSLREEVFGPTTLLVKSAGKEDLIEIAMIMEGQLTATIHGTEEDLRNHADLIDILETKAGRLLFNGFPTGVEVCHSMVHGGPYPATSDSRSTSVGTRAIERFARLVCYQDFPDDALPPELKTANPLGILRMIDGRYAATNNST